MRGTFFACFCPSCTGRRLWLFPWRREDLGCRQGADGGSDSGTALLPAVHKLRERNRFGALFAVGLPFGWWDGVGSFRAQYFDDPTVFYVTARLVTAAFGALLAPIFYLCARRIGLAPGTSLITGLLAALFPLAVYQSHIAKGDVAMATFIVAAIAATLARVGTDRPFRWDALFGLAVVLALSFKHSAVFVLAPLALGHLLILGFREGARAAGLAFLRGIIVVLILWPILNIGTILDFKTFLEYQQIQSVMSIRGNDGPLSGVATPPHDCLISCLG